MNPFVFLILSLTSLVAVGQQTESGITVAKLLKMDSMSQKSLEIVKDFAERYSPKSISHVTIANIDDDTPFEVIEAIRHLRNTREHEKFLTLIFLKLYRSHLECCYGPVDVRRYLEGIDSVKSPLLFEFNRLTGRYDLHRYGLILSSLGIEWLRTHLSLLKYEPINAEFQRIKKLEEGIEKHVLGE